MLALLILMVGGCESADPVSTDAHDFSNVNSQQDLSVLGHLDNDDPRCFEKKSEVCAGVQSPANNKNCFRYVLGGPPCARACIRIRNSPGYEKSVYSYVKGDDGQYIKGTDGKYIRERRTVSDKCCYKKELEGDFLPIWRANEDPECKQEIAAIETEQGTLPQATFAEERRHFESRLDVCAGMLEGLPVKKRSCYTLQLSGPKNERHCRRIRKLPGDKKWTPTKKSDDVDVLESGKKVFRTLSNGTRQQLVRRADKCCLRNDVGVPLDKADLDCVAEEEEHSRQAELEASKPEVESMTPPKSTSLSITYDGAPKPIPATTPNNQTTPTSPAPVPTATLAELNNLNCRSTAPGAWPATWVAKENAILAALNKHRQKEEAYPCIDMANQCSVKTSTIADTLVMDDKLRIAARCHALKQAKNRCFSHYDDGIEKGRPWVDRVKAAGYVSAEIRDFYSSTGYQDTGEPSEIIRHWPTSNWRSLTHEMDTFMKGFIDSYGHCLPIMNKAKRYLGGNCEAVDAPYTEAGIGVVDVGAIEKNEAITCQGSLPKERNYLSDRNYFGAINFGVPGR